MQHQHSALEIGSVTQFHALYHMVNCAIFNSKCFLEKKLNHILGRLSRQYISCWQRRIIRRKPIRKRIQLLNWPLEVLNAQIFLNIICCCIFCQFAYQDEGAFYLWNQVLPWGWNPSAIPIWNCLTLVAVVNLFTECKDLC